MTNQKILIITYYWPPSGGVGVQRWMNYAIQLKKRGWEPIIYTPENPQFEITDTSQLDRVKDIRVVKHKIWEPYRLFHSITGGRNKGKVQQGLVLEKKSKSWLDGLMVWARGNLMIPDPRKFWVMPSVRFLQKFILSENIETIITTGPPHSMHLIGLGLKKKLNVSWLADFRDPWSDWDVLDKLQVSGSARQRHAALERKVLTEADLVITVSEHLKRSLEEKAKSNVEVLYNAVTSTGEVPAAKKDGDALVIGYFGMLNEMRNPEELWPVLNELAVESNVKLRLGGILSDSIKAQIQKLSNLSDRAEFLGYVDHEKIGHEYARCDILLLLLNRTDNARWIIPVKFFEYLAAHRFVLGLGPEDSDLAKLASGLPNFKMLDFTAKDDMKKLLVEFEPSANFSAENEFLKKFSHESLATTLEQMIISTHGKA